MFCQVNHSAVVRRKLQLSTPTQNIYKTEKKSKFNNKQLNVVHRASIQSSKHGEELLAHYECVKGAHNQDQEQEPA